MTFHSFVIVVLVVVLVAVGGFISGMIWKGKALRKVQ